LAKSIAAQGLLQPIVVIQKPQGGRYEVLAGHIRFEACKKLGWKSIPAVIRETREPAQKEKTSEPSASSRSLPKQA
jgi:ParB family chromosome partitioning protein